MKILYLCADSGIDVAGVKGASIHVCALVRAFADLGHEVTVLCTTASCPESLQSDLNARVLVSPLASWIRSVRNLLRSFNRFLGRTERRNLDLVKLLHNFGFRKAVSHAVRQTKPDFIYERYSLWAVAGLEVAKQRSIPLVLEVNAPLAYEEQAYRAGLTFAPVARWVERLLWRRADVVIPVSGALRERMINARVAPERIHVLPNAVDIDLFRADVDGQAVRDRFQLANRFVVGFVGSFKAWHGIDFLLEAFQDLHRSDPLTHLLLVGEGPLRETLEAHVRNMGLEDSVTFVGGVQHQEIPQYLAAMDAAIAPYPALEDFYYSPLKLFEYMAAGRAVVSSRIGQVAEVISDGLNGLLFEPGDRTGLVECIQRLRKNPKLQAELGRNATAACSQNTWKQHAVRVVEWVEPLTTSRAGSSAATSDLPQYPLSDVGTKN
jgi:glycosyltransferase involved in cell wall biosynthesis